MQVRLDILDDRLEAIDETDERGRLRAYLALWRAGEIDPLRDQGVVVIVGLGTRPGEPPRPLVVNDGEGDGRRGGGEDRR